MVGLSANYGGYMLESADRVGTSSGSRRQEKRSTAWVGRVD